MTSLSAGPRPSRRSHLPAWPGARPLRAWQATALERVLEHPGEAFLASATPAAGKTTFGLRVAYELLGTGRVARVCVVAPTTHICRQWAADAARYGIDLEPNRPNAAGPEPRDRHGVVVTYQTVAAGAGVHRRRCAELPTLLIADEPHHLGEDAAWGQATVAAFARAEFRLLLSGTPFRSDNAPIPWVTYDEDGVSCADYAYGYTDALLEGVCRPVTFHPYDGDMEWVSDGRRRKADFSVALPAAESARRLRTALDPDGDWVADVLRDADRTLAELRAGDHPDAGGLVVAADKLHAERLAGHLTRITGEPPEVVTSDLPDASARIGRFAAGAQRWLVAVLMVSEGVDVPRLRVGVYATSARTELFFRQVVGRFVRRTPTPREQMSHVFLPADPRLKTLAAQVEEERNHALVDKPAAETVEREAPPERADAEAAFRALWSSARREDDVLRTTQPGDALQLFGEPAPVGGGAGGAGAGGAGAGGGGASGAGPGAVAARAFATATSSWTGAPGSSAQLGATPVPPSPAAPSAESLPETPHERRERLREERRALVAAVARRTGEPHRAVHGRVNRESGAKSVAAATEAQLVKGNRLLEREAGRRR